MTKNAYLLTFLAIALMVIPSCRKDNIEVPKATTQKVNHVGIRPFSETSESKYMVDTLTIGEGVTLTRKRSSRNCHPSPTRGHIITLDELYDDSYPVYFWFSSSYEDYFYQTISISELTNGIKLSHDYDETDELHWYSCIATNDNLIEMDYPVTYDDTDDWLYIQVNNDGVPIDEQTDVLVGCGWFRDNDIGGSTLYYEHALAGIEVKIGKGFDGIVKSLTVNDAPTWGDLYFNENEAWCVVDEFTTEDLVVFSGASIAVTTAGNVDLTPRDDSKTILLIPVTDIVGTSCTLVINRGGADETFYFDLPGEIGYGELVTCILNFEDPAKDLVYSLTNTSGTVTLPGFSLPSGCTAKVTWGDGQKSSYTSSATTISHSYSGTFNGNVDIGFSKSGVAITGNSSVSFEGGMYIYDKVTSINADAMRYNTKSFTLNVMSPNYEFIIGERAFSGCTGLYGVYLGGKAWKYIRVNREAFKNCTNLEWLKFNENEHNNYFAFGGQVFYGCTSLKYLKTESYVHGDDSCFMNCTALQTVDLRDNADVSYFMQYTFSGCSSLTDINIRNNYIGGSSLRECPAVTNISVGSGNGYWYPGNALVFKDSKSTYKMTQNSTFSAVTIESINPYAYHSYDLRAVTIPNAKKLEWYCVYNSPNLYSLTIPSTVTSMHPNFISGCPMLKTLRFLGSTAPSLIVATEPLWELGQQVKNGKVYCPQGSTGYESLCQCLTNNGWTIIYE